MEDSTNRVFYCHYSIQVAAIVSIQNPVEAPLISTSNNTSASDNTSNSTDTQLTVTIPTERTQDVDD